MDRPDVIAVRTEVVAQLMVDDLFAAALTLARQPLPAGTVAVLTRAGEAITANASAEADGRLPARLARLGHDTRRAERDRFERAREPCPWLEELLRAARADSRTAGGPGGAVARIAVDLARREPLERPSPTDPAAATWRIPGPGGHVRHLLVLRALEQEGVRDPALKRAWAYGFVVAAAASFTG